ncbi:MAG: orotidine-5'-phosphate decarboxylase [Hyphomicrobiaceae bacterium]
MAETDPRDRLFVALDLATVEEARSLVARLDDAVTCYKVGLELVFAGGLAFAEELRRSGKQVFLDVKLLDIANTVEKAARNIATLDLQFLTVHGTDRKTLAAAVKGRGATGLKLLAVTVLTSLDEKDLAEQGAQMSPGDLVVHRARLAHAAGFDGVIASGLEAGRIRAAVGSGFLIVTPGIRPAGGAADDQSRVATPASAIASGADRLVVGRPITQASDPRAAAQAITAEISDALKGLAGTRGA